MVQSYHWSTLSAFFPELSESTNPNRAQSKHQQKVESVVQARLQEQHARVKQDFLFVAQILSVQRAEKLYWQLRCIVTRGTLTTATCRWLETYQRRHIFGKAVASLLDFDPERPHLSISHSYINTIVTARLLTTALWVSPVL